MRNADYMLTFWKRDLDGVQRQRFAYVQDVSEAEAVTQANGCKANGGMAVSVWKVTQVIKLAD